MPQRRRTCSQKARRSWPASSGPPSKAASRWGHGPAPASAASATSRTSVTSPREQSSSFPLVGLQVPRTQHGDVFSARLLGHGASFPVLAW